MIRKVIIVVLTLAALTIAFLWVDSSYHPRAWARFPPPRVRKAFDWGAVNVDKRLHLVRGMIYIRYYVLIDKNNTPGKWFGEFLGIRWSASRHRPIQIPWYSSRPKWSGEFLLKLNLRIPFWAPFVLAATYPAIAFIRGPLRRNRRRRRNLCINCGYDLTGNVSGACPECGAEVTVT